MGEPNPKAQSIRITDRNIKLTSKAFTSGKSSRFFDCYLLTNLLYILFWDMSITRSKTIETKCGRE